MSSERDALHWLENKSRFPKRHLLLTPTETYEVFKKEIPDVEMRKSALMTKMGSIIIVSRCVYIPSRTPWQMLFAVIQIYDRWVWKNAWMSNYSSFASSKMWMILIGWSRNSSGAQVYLISFYNRQKHTVLCQTPWCSSSTSRSQFKWLSFLKTIQAAAYERPDRNCVSASHGGRREPHLSLRGWDTACSLETKTDYPPTLMVYFCPVILNFLIVS